MNMYKISSNLITQLKKVEYKINTTGDIRELKIAIKDIDIFVKEDYSICDNLFEVKTNVVSETVTDVNGEKITRVGFKINDINICIFRVKGESLQHSIFEFSRRKIKIQNCNHAIIAKLAYSKKRDKDNRPFPSTTKHIKDVEDIFGILDDIDNYVPKVSNGLR